MSDDGNQPESTAPLHASAAVPAQPIRFCRVCGTMWDVGWDRCEKCDALARPLVDEAKYQIERKALRSALRLYMALLVVCIGVYVASAALGRDLSVEEDFIAAGLLAAVTLAWVLAWRGPMFRLARRFGHLAWFGIAAIGACATYSFAVAAMRFLTFITGLPDTRYLDVYDSGGYGFAWAVLGVAVLPAVFEELAFRGVILQALSSLLTPIESAIVCAMMFAILHLSPASIPHLFLIGMAAALLRQWSGSLYPCMLLHFTHNLLCILSERSGSFLPWS